MISSRLRKSRGFTLIELIISIVVVSIALGGVLLAVNYTVTHSADPMLQHQAVAIAESYLEEILLKSFADPDGSEVGESRGNYDDVDDYDGLSDGGAKDQRGNGISGLENYTVEVVVANTALNGISASDSKKIIVTVRHPIGFNMTVSGYRTKY